MFDHEPIFLPFSVDTSVEDGNHEKVNVLKEAAGMLTEIFHWTLNQLEPSDRPALTQRPSLKLIQLVLSQEHCAMCVIL